ncbi:outer membrane lipoprotein-sorting protein [Alishewanella sp. HH-ZS]|nr:outer membrane lipoprotein-sorting protein [Alishewanella sp. HH-ZS]
MKKLTLLASAVALVFSCNALAKLPADQVARLGQDLTPVGAEKAGNAAGTIPEWTGGILAAPAGYKPGDHHPNPFADDKILFTITKANLEQYRQFLSPGQIALFDLYPDTFKMNIYPTRRSASFPQYFYDATKKIAANAELVEGGNGLRNAAIGIPFPIPSNGLEAIWNHIVRYRGVAASRNGGQAAPTAQGAYTLIGFEEQIMFKYSHPDATPEALQAENILFRFKQSVTTPARLAGTALLVHETMDQVATPRQAWTYNTGQRRVRRAPNVAYDAPGTASDGLRTTDDFDMFNGSPDRYNWELKGKREMYIAYNDYKLHSNNLKYSDILMPGHINPEHVRYEKHRVWVVEATLKEGTRHVYGKRVFFIDEDSWQIHVADLYDNRGDLYRVAVAHGLNYYEVPTHWSTLEVYHDLNSRRYIAIGLDNEDKMYDFSVTLSDNDFTPASLRREGTR